MVNTTPVHIAISYHTETDRLNVHALGEALQSVGVVPEKLDYLTVHGLITEYCGPGLVRRDAWIEHFSTMLERSAGMIVVEGEHTRVSQRSGGMHIEERLAFQWKDTDPEYIRFVMAPGQSSQEVNDPSSWAEDVVGTLKEWIAQRSKSGRLGLIRRFPSAEFNLLRPYDLYEIQFATTEYRECSLRWFYISVLDLYDRVWHCRRCLAASDVWEYPNSRPPAKCPACGSTGGET